MSVATRTLPLVLIAGKDFGYSVEVAQTETGAAEDLDDVGAVEFRMKRQGLPDEPAVVWSMASGHIEIVGTEIVLRVTGDETEDLKVGSWKWLLSIGATEAEDPLVQGVLNVTAEP